MNSIISQNKPLEELIINDGINLAHQVYLSSISAQNQLRHWKPWILTQAFIGHSLETNVKGLGIAIEATENDEESKVVDYNFLSKNNGKIFIYMGISQIKEIIRNLVLKGISSS